MIYRSVGELISLLKEYQVYFSNGESVTIKAHRDTGMFPFIEFERDYVDNSSSIVAKFNFNNIAGYKEKK